MNIRYVRFECEHGHVTAVKWPVEGVTLEHCAVCGSTDVEQIESQSIDADVLADADLLDSEA
jgi:hypothetical protein